MTSTDARIDRLERQVEALLAKVEEQAATIKAQATEITELKRRLGENSSNSSKPPSTDPPAVRAERPDGAPSGKRRGGQPGHKGHRRELLPLSQVTDRQDCFPPSCRACEAPLPKTRDAEPLVRQVIDVPDIKPAVTQYDCHHVQCTCGVTTCGAPPPGTPSGLLGPRVLALCGLVVADCNVSRRKVRELLHHLLGIRVSLGALSESEETTNDAVAPAVDEARLHALGERVKHVDATSWSCAGAYRCLWTMATAAVTVFFIATDGTRATLETWISKARGVLVTDRGTQFGFWAMERRQICWAHLLRKVPAATGSWAVAPAAPPAPTGTRSTPRSLKGGRVSAGAASSVRRVRDVGAGVGAARLPPFHRVGDRSAAPSAAHHRRGSGALRSDALTEGSGARERQAVHRLHRARRQPFDVREWMRAQEN